MNNLVTVRKNEDGTFISKTKNKDIGFVIYEQKAVELRNGWYADKSLSALVLGPIALLESMDHSKPLTGKIIVREQLEPFNDKDLTYKLKYAGDSKVVCMKGDKPIFGICLGNQLMGLASGADTYKLKYGHRSHNQPVLQKELPRYQSNLLGYPMSTEL